jgi:hypothetical protein
MKTFLVFSLGTRILILTIIKEWNHPQIPLVHERKKAIDWKDGGI